MKAPQGQNGRSLFPSQLRPEGKHCGETGLPCLGRVNLATPSRETCYFCVNEVRCGYINSRGLFDGRLASSPGAVDLCRVKSIGVASCIALRPIIPGHWYSHHRAEISPITSPPRSTTNTPSLGCVRKIHSFVGQNHAQGWLPTLGPVKYCQSKCNVFAASLQTDHSTKQRPMPLPILHKTQTSDRARCKYPSRLLASNTLLVDVV